MALEKTALVGLHDKSMEKSVQRIFRSLDYTVTAVTDHVHLLSCLTANQYTWCIMDTNYGQPNTPTAEPAIQAYKLTKGNFMSLSANDVAIRLALEAGIPAISKWDMAAMSNLSSKF
ncbi:MAG TPA: hypothetical protein VK158_03570 [Acidobacteriota bacterium]|nr:hypothetical protein [Acidobacteriota bacterium]